MLASGILRGSAVAEIQTEIIGRVLACRPDQAFHERVLPGFLTRCWAGCQDRQPAANPYRATRARAVVQPNLALPLLSKPYPRPCPRPCRIGLTLLSIGRFLARLAGMPP